MKGKPVRTVGAFAVSALVVGTAIAVLFAPAASGGGKAQTKVIVDSIAGPEERKPAESKLTLRLKYDKSTETRIWSTRIKSEKASCEPQRQVFVYQKVDGPDTEIGQSTSDEDGKGGLSDSGQPPFSADEFYYAKAPFKSNKCDEIKSKVVHGDNSPMRTSERKPVKTKAKLFLSYFPESDTRTYMVRVKSDKDSCKPGRTVEYFQKVDGPDDELGTASSNDFGIANLDKSPEQSFMPGEEFYAKVLKKGNSCAPVKTKVVKVEAIP